MLNLDDLKDKFTETFNQVKDTVEESSLYNTLRERYETLPSNGQRAIVIGSITFVVLIFLSIPWSFLSSSSNYVTEFEDSRALIRGLLKTRSLSKGAPLPKGMSSGEIESKAKGMLSTAGLLDSQIGSSMQLPEGDPGSRLAPPNVQQQGVRLELKQLNLRQIIDIGYQLQNLDASVKMTGMEVHATAEDPHYFNATFKLISFSLPETEEASAGKDAGGPKGKKRGRGK
ncbi:MAG: hypothetical protein H6624_01075 [Bdellovibrionaceae bacterium]|nr:hypothetical protein [Bdellovibrionales bacterium]MCB9082901.1 hypothetical protein [Pseudobdellovibrionaceae bacterium]